MKPRVLLTGGTGFIGRSVLRVLGNLYEFFAPSRAELNVNDLASVRAYLAGKQFDVLLHCALNSPLHNPQDKPENTLALTLQAFFNLTASQAHFGKILYIGSGAEYDKRRDIHLVREEEIGQYIPADPYGLAKYTLNQLARQSQNIYNLRIFGCYGPTDAKTKFIRDAIDCALADTPITIRQDCLFDYLYVDDLARLIAWFIENTPQYHDYNVVSGRPVALSALAKTVARLTGHTRGIQIAKPGLNKEYTAANARLLAEVKNFAFTPLDEGISRQLAWQKEYVKQTH